jgi:hypothetical protein
MSNNVTKQQMFTKVTDDQAERLEKAYDKFMTHRMFVVLKFCYENHSEPVAWTHVLEDAVEMARELNDIFPEEQFDWRIVRNSYVDALK